MSKLTGHSGRQDGHGRELLDADQLADRLGRSKRWIYRQVERQCPVYRVGRSLLFDPAAVDAWLSSQRAGEWQDAA
jgi:excisionase family DNA binding protein